MIPPRIARGQTLGVVAPAGPVRAERVPPALALLADAFTVQLAPSVLGPREPATPSYLAASDEIRAAELNAMLRDPDVRAIAMVRGGYGLMRILPWLDAAALRADPKPLIGFSDGTALLAWAHAAGVRGIHGPVLAQLGDLPPADVTRFIDILTTPGTGARPYRLASVSTATVTGPLVPANLTLASMLVGTPWPVPLAGAIALFEEVGEKPYELDRYLTQLALTGALPHVAAAILGDLTRCHDPAPPVGVDPAEAAVATVRERLASTPLATGAPVGHGARNDALPFGALATLDCARGTLTLHESAVA